MSDYIKRENAIGAILDKYVDYAGLVDLIESVPSADVVEVVRCKDCKYYDRDNIECTNSLVTHFPCGRRGPGDYCSFGECKDGGDHELDCKVQELKRQNESLKNLIIKVTKSMNDEELEARINKIFEVEGYGTHED